MKRVVSVMCLLVSVFLCPFASVQTSHAQKPVQGSKTPTFLIEPFDLRQTRLKPKFLGNSLPEIYESLLSRDKYFQKSEFETQGTFAERIERFSTTPISNGIRPQDNFAFVITPDTSYDAEKELLTVRLSSDDDVYLAGQSVSCNWAESTKAGTSYVGSNAFGVKKLIRRVNKTRYNVVFDRPYWLDTAYKHTENYTSTGGLFIEQKPGIDALLLSRTIRVVLIGPLDVPFVSHSVGGDDPTMTKPIDLTIFEHNIHMSLAAVWLVNIVTGEIIQKYSSNRGSISSTVTDTPKGQPMASRSSAPEIAEQPQPTAPVFVREPPISPARISGGIMAGSLIVKTAAVYPAAARAAHVSGAVVLHVIISKEGIPEKVDVISGPEMLRSNALEAVRQWQYRPYTVNGEPVPVDTTVTVNFNFDQR